MSETGTGVQLPPPGIYTVDTQKSSITFATRHLFGMGGVTGSFAIRYAEVEVSDPISASTVNVEVDAESFDTGSAGRDVKVRSDAFLDVQNHPAITFTSDNFLHDNGTLTLSGVLTVRGKPAPLNLTVESATVIDGVLTLEATGTVDRYAHGITAMKGMAGRRLKMTVAATTVKNVPPATASAPDPKTTLEPGATPAPTSTTRKVSTMPEPTKISVVYYSSTGTVYELASLIADGARAAGAEVRVRKVHELAPKEAIESNQGWASHAAQTQDVIEATPEDMTWADAVIFGTPTRFGNVAAQLKQYLDSLGGLWFQGLLADKVYSGFTATSTTHGGQESTLLALYNSIHHFGGIIVSPGYTDPIKFADGNPYGTGHVAGQGDIAISDITKQAAQFQGNRVARLTTALKVGLAQ